jgi:hypothetical protein
MSESQPAESTKSAVPEELDAEVSADAEHRAYVEAWERAHPGQPFPRPWQTAEDARGWRTVARGKNWPARPETDVEVRAVLSPDDYVWLARRAKRAGLRPSQYLAWLVADARAHDGAEEGGGKRAPAVRAAGRGSDRKADRDSAAAR